MNYEILNIDYHVQRLVLKALNKYESTRRAAMALGITERTLYRYKRQYSIVRDSSGLFISYSLTQLSKADEQKT